MNKMELSEKWRERVFDYLGTTQISFLINGLKTGTIRPTRRLCQGCPLFSYLFLLCYDGLPTSIVMRVNQGRVQGNKCARAVPVISQELLQCYERAYGQFINMQKSSITLSPNTTLLIKNNVLGWLNMPFNESYESYLAFTAFMDHNKKCVFEGVKENVRKRMQGWKNQLFSSIGNEILIKAVAQATNTYTMKFFLTSLAIVKIYSIVNCEVLVG